MAGHRLERFADGYTFLEGPRWHEGRLWVSDYFSKRVLAFDLDGNPETIAEVDGMPAGLGFLPDGTPLVVSQADRAVYRIADGRLQLHAELGALAGGMANDMVVATDGTAYVGNHGFDMSAGEEPRPTTLARISPDGQVTAAAEDCIFPNGSVITDDGRTLLVAESFANRISAWDIAPDGSLANRRTWAQLDESLTPDGICMDAEGGIWAGNPLVSRFTRIEEGGTITDEIPTPGRWAVACVFGGPDRTTLFLLSAETSMEDQPRGISTARIDVTEPGVAGAGIP